MTIAQQLRDFIAENFLFGEGADSLHGDESLVEAGVIDSTGVLELVTFLENVHGLTIRDEELIPENLDSINRLTAFIEAKQAGNLQTV